jgi:hypothetical protein
LFLGCDDTPPHQKTTQWRLKDTLKDCEEYSVRLADMRESPGYQHKYKVRCGNTDTTTPDELTKFATIDTGWITVDSATYNKNKWDLDRNILTRNNKGEVSGVSQPPGYQYVGDPKYGEWKANEAGKTEWIFIPMFFGGSSPPPVYQQDYNSYSEYRRQGTPYYRPDYEDRIRQKYSDRKPNFYEKLKQQKRTRPTVDFQKKPDFYDNIRAKEAVKDRNDAMDRATGKRPVYNTVPKHDPPETTTKPLSFKEKMGQYKSGEKKAATNVSGYGVKTSKKFQIKSATPPKKKPGLKERFKTKVKKIKTKVKKTFTNKKRK